MGSPTSRGAGRRTVGRGCACCGPGCCWGAGADWTVRCDLGSTLSQALAWRLPLRFFSLSMSARPSCNSAAAEAISASRHRTARNWTPGPGGLARWASNCARRSLRSSRREEQSAICRSISAISAPPWPPAPAPGCSVRRASRKFGSGRVEAAFGFAEIQCPRIHVSQVYLFPQPGEVVTQRIPLAV